MGTIIGVCVAGVFAWVFGKVTHLTGYSVSDVENLVYVEQNTDIQVGELLFAGILIAALGAVMDVSMSIASTICEIHQKNPALTTRELFHSGMNVGKKREKKQRSIKKQKTAADTGLIPCYSAAVF